jgi:hypothetical protein
MEAVMERDLKQMKNFKANLLSLVVCTISALAEKLLKTTRNNI